MASALNRLNLYFKNLYLDYSEVFREIAQSARKHPVKASIYGSLTLFSLNLFRTNEGLRSYSSEVISACNRLATVSEASRNPYSDKFVQTVGELNGHGLLRQLDLGFSTIIYRADANSDLALFRYNCSHLKPSISEFFKERIVDLGLLGHWIRLELGMIDYDINEVEYSQTELNSDKIDTSSHTQANK